MKKQTININGEKAIIVQTDGKGGGAMIAIGLREGCPDCGEIDCERTCESQAQFQDSNRELVKESRLLFNAAIHGIEAFILALACEGVKIENAQFEKALKTVLDKIGERYD
jgi:hypothetical protein